jgi:hypothetical protein
LEISIVVLLCTIACDSPTSPSVPAGAARVTGTVQFFNLEGGFWAIRGDDGVTYDPKDGLPAAYQREGMRVSVIVRVRTDLASVHMAGPLVDLLDIRAR